MINSLLNCEIKSIKEKVLHESPSPPWKQVSDNCRVFIFVAYFPTKTYPSYEHVQRKLEVVTSFFVSAVKLVSNGVFRKNHSQPRSQGL